MTEATSISNAMFMTSSKPSNPPTMTSTTSGVQTMGMTIIHSSSHARKRRGRYAWRQREAASTVATTSDRAPATCSTLRTTGSSSERKS